jgi:plasmid stabilization system protein ParE
MNYSFRFHPDTRQDFSEAFSWYEDKQKGLGERFIKAVEQKLAEIGNNPYSFGSRVNKTFREAMVDMFPYLIVYKLNKKDVEILISSIHNTKKHPGKKYRKI